jgi:uncharacterized protein
MNGLCTVKLLAFILVIIGALNVALAGVFDMDVLARIFGEGTMATKVVAGLIGIAAIILVVFCKRCKSECKTE